MCLEKRVKRVNRVGLILYVIFALLTMRISYIMLLWSKDLSVILDRQYTLNERTRDINFSLLDCNGNDLLTYVNKYFFVVDADTFIKSNRDTDIELIKTVTYILRNYSEKYDLSALQPGMKMKQEYSIDETTYNKLREIKGVKGIYTYMKREVDRTAAWNYENLLSDFLTVENTPKSANSIEGLIHEATKDNGYQMMSFQRDVTGEIYEKGIIEPQDNVNVRLTTDKGLQDIVKEVINEPKYENYDQVGVVLMEASSGKIRAMVQRDDWKPNILLCSTTGNGYEPGSIFKTIVQEAAMYKKGISIDKRFQCDEKKKNHGYLNMSEAYAVSCNAYFRKLGKAVGFSDILSVAESQGLFSKVLNFNGNEEVAGTYLKPTSENGALSMLSIGQSMNITPVGALSIVNTVVNNGNYVMPYLVDSFIKGNGEVVKQFDTEEKAVISSKTAQTMKNEMIDVVKSGTARAADISGIETGGKTGTSTRPETIRKSSGEQEETVLHSDGWFTGFYKYKDKYYSMVVFVKDIDFENDSAGTTAVPIFKEIVEKITGVNQ